MPAIDYIIPNAQFEIFRDQIALILADEIANQGTLGSGDADLSSTKVVTEHFYQFNPQTDTPIVNVMLASIPYDEDGHFLTASRGNNTYFIDVMTTSKAIGGDDPAYLSKKKNHKLLRVIRYILESAEYLKLGLDPSILASTKVSLIEFDRPKPVEDANAYVISRITFVVIADECVRQSEPFESGGTDTTFKIDDETGYVVTVDNN